MALTTNEMSAADIAAVTRNNENGFGFGGDGAWWIIILFLFVFMGGGYGGNAGAAPYVVQANTGNELQRGFDQASVMSALGDISGNIINGFAQAEIGANARQMTGMQQDFNSQTALMQQLNSIAMTQQNCCCENRAAIADLKYTIATEACADRAAIQAGIQTILDKMCQQELDAERRENDNLRQQINMMNLAASQTAQTAQLVADNTAQTQYIVNRVAPYPIPSYTVPNPFATTTTTATSGN